MSKYVTTNIVMILFYCKNTYFTRQHNTGSHKLYISFHIFVSIEILIIMFDFYKSVSL